MTEAPERIFAYRWGLDGSNSGWNAFKPAGVHTCTAAEYVRADLYAALEAQLAEAWEKEGFLAEKLKQAGTERDTWKERAMVLRLSALEATPPASKVKDEMVQAALSAAYPQGWDLADKIRIQKALTAAQEAGKP